MYILDKIRSESRCLNKITMLTKNKISKRNLKKECYIEVNYKEDRLEVIKNKLNEMECSILSYNQYQEVSNNSVISINIKEIEKVYKNILSD